MERTEAREPIVNGQEGGQPPPSPAPGAAGNAQTGTIRSDIQFIPPGEHGDHAMIYDPLAESYYKLSDRSCRILRLLDRNYPLDEFLARVKEAGIDADREELLEILSFMHNSGLMVPEYGVMDNRTGKYREMKEKTLFNRIMSMYLFFKLPPIHPDRFFTATMPFVKVIFNRYFLWILALAALAGYVLMIRQWNEAYAMFLNSLSWTNLVNYFWALLVTKTVHELAHGYTAKSFGARIRSMGVSFIVFYPRLFVDLTDTWRLSRARRIACDGAGIASELIFGGLAAIVWVYAQPGPLRSTMFYLVTVSALGTILVNGNPFIRYDGYYLLCDLLNVENLMSRSIEYVKSWNRRFFLGLGFWPDSGDASPLTLYFFGLGSFIYRLFLYTSIILVIYFQFTKALAVLLMALEAYVMLLLPFFMEMKLLFRYHKNLNLVKTGFVLLLIAALVSLFFVPLPWSFALPCEIVPETSRIVTVRESAFAEAELDDDPVRVKKGDRILPFSNVFLDFSILRYAALVRQNEAELDLMRADTKTFGFSPVVFEKLRVNQLTCEEMKRRRGSLDVVAETDGIFVPSIKDVSPGRWLEKGTVLGQIVSEKTIVYAYALDREVNRINPGDKVTLKLRGELDGHKGVVETVNPVAVKFRDSTLVQRLGGTVPCYPPSSQASKPAQKTMEFTPVNVLYCVTVSTESPLSKLVGRTGTAYVEQTYKLSVEIGRQLLHIFFREFTF
ncbi:MAG: putative peptide zinc metalloprotease protein YydH [Lentisphaerae bacterium ADurb.Bin242]|nr:MAG: putative peptide zinc metalloprotease protein YydH [Lentisphaerae bacterium ADurb.Bin242]